MCIVLTQPRFTVAMITGQGSTEEDNSATTSTSDDEPMLTLNASREISLKTLNFMQVIIDDNADFDGLGA